MKAVAFFSDKNMLPGLHVALASLVKSTTKRFLENVRIFIFLDNVDEKEKDILRATFALASNQHDTLVFRDFSPSAPIGGNLLHGNATTYGRIYLSELLPDIDQCLYLDSDLIVNNDISDFFKHFDNDHILLVGQSGNRSYSLDCKLYEEAGLNMNENCFSAGVLGINLKLWRLFDACKLCRDTAKKYSGKFKSGDQALLNIALHDSFKSLGEEWNYELEPSSKKVEFINKYIYHFIGSPKPWDIAGCYLNNNYHLWYSFYKNTVLGNQSPWVRYSSLKRNVRVSKTYYKALLKKFKNKC